MPIRPFLPLSLLLLALLGGCGTSDSVDEAPLTPTPPLTHAELARAAALVHGETAREDAHLTHAWVTVTRGTVAQPNTGSRCDSGRLLHLVLVGRFPHIVTGGTPSPVQHTPPQGTPSQEPLPVPDLSHGDVHVLLVTADAATGRACRIGVATRAPRPVPDATPIDVGE